MNPFTDLGLPAAPDLDDEQVRHAWRAIAAATHPDRADGGDPAAYAAAAAAYARLRTAWGRSEALADLTTKVPPPPSPGLAAPSPDSTAWRTAAQLPGRIRRGRPARLAARTAAATTIALTTLTVIPGTPSAPAVVTGCALWWALTIRSDLAPPPGR